MNSRSRTGFERAADMGNQMTLMEVLTQSTPRKNGAYTQPEEAVASDQRAAEFIVEGFVTLTAVQANMVLLECQYDRQRKIVKPHVDDLADLMTRGQWEAKDKLDFARHDGKLILVNGYHRMLAQARCGKPIQWTVVIHDCRTFDQVRNLYYKFDTNVRKRSGAQVLGGIAFAEESGLTRKMASAVFNAVPFITSGFSAKPRDRTSVDTRVMDRRLRIAQEYIEAALKYQTCLEDVPPKMKQKFLNGGVASVALVTLRWQPVKAKEFWYGAAQNDGLRKGDPRLALYNDLNARKMNSGAAVQNIFVPARAWNAFFHDRDLKIIKVYENETRPVYIDGTPFER